MPPDLLVFDTSGPWVAVGAGAVTRVERLQTGQGERLFPLIDEVLAEAKLARTDLARLVVSTGPGNFTGTRIGVAAARSMAVALSVPAVGVSRLQALAALVPGAQRVGVAAYRGHSYVQGCSAGALVGAPGLLTDAALEDGTNLHHDGTIDGFSPHPLEDVIGSMAAIGAAADPATRPAPLYLRAPDAAAPTEATPAILD
ncbi:MAG: tRNA (adenosine(37)-N6)-threonylcarbamoyltransferase complex dimerization subunit type 1 TsaB [Pseudomonadota bacterium]